MYKKSQYIAYIINSGKYGMLLYNTREISILLIPIGIIINLFLKMLEFLLLLQYNFFSV